MYINTLTCTGAYAIVRVQMHLGIVPLLQKKR